MVQLKAAAPQLATIEGEEGGGVETRGTKFKPCVRLDTTRQS
jgi:hypothetical protein